MTEIYFNIVTSIAFYPIIITILYLILVAAMLRFDYSEVARELSKELRWLKFKEMGAVRAIMTTLIAGIISLMALSFSMVMVVLNQATTTVSPKVMQGLITKKEHQFVLGNQFGSILYFIVLLLLLRGFDYYRMPTFSITLGLLIGFWSMGLFVYFIHSISQSIQVTNIVSSIHQQCFKSLRHLLHKNEKNLEKGEPVPAPIGPDETPFEFVTDKPGFLQEVNLKTLLKLLRKDNIKILMEPRFTDYVATGATLFRASVPPVKLSEQDRKQIFNNILFFNNERIEINYVYGFTQLGEIAIKSLSPGINDPGIAVMCIHYLTDLFVNLYTLKEVTTFADEEHIARIQVKNLTLPDLLTMTISPIRNYGHDNESVVRALLGLLLALAREDLQQRRYQKLLNQHAEAVLLGLNEALKVPVDAVHLNRKLDQMFALKPAYFNFKRPLW